VDLSSQHYLVVSLIIGLAGNLSHAFLPSSPPPHLSLIC
jgi:hypothetical protein